MTVKLNDKFLKSFVSEEEIKAEAGALAAAHEKIVNRSGEGSDFLGWYTLPNDYDKEEFARIKKAAKKIQETSEVLVVIGIGGSYLGARAAIEFLTSPNYNLLSKKTPNIYFAGNSISALSFDEGVIHGLHGDKDVLEMELEWYYGNSEDFQDIAESLAEKYSLEPEDISKLQRGFLPDDEPEK